MGEIPSLQHGQEYRATTLRLEWPRRHVALVTLARPEERNAISVETIHELGEALSVAHRQRAGALVITGAGRSFCAGANLKTLASPDSPFFRDPMMFRDKFSRPWRRSWIDSRRCHSPSLPRSAGTRWAEDANSPSRQTFGSCPSTQFWRCLRSSSGQLPARVACKN